MIELINKFCLTNNPKFLTDLDPYSKQFIILCAKYCIENKKGDIKRSNIIMNTIGMWEYQLVPKGTVLYRGVKSDNLDQNRATYYTKNIETANIYLSKSKKGFLKIYKVKNDILLFRLDNLDNANKLLEITFSDKKIVCGKKILAKTMYDIVRKNYTGILVPPIETTHIKINRLFRNSVTCEDLVFSNWLCEKGLSGYYAEDMKQRMGHIFPAELMLCKPLDVLTEIETIETKRLSVKKLSEIDNRIK